MTGQRKREIVGRSVSHPPETASARQAGSRSGRFYVRDPEDYPTYPKNGRFRYSGLAKGYMYRWDLFLTGKTDEVPPTFREYSKNPGEAMKDTRRVEAAFRLGGQRSNKEQEHG